MANVSTHLAAMCLFLLEKKFLFSQQKFYFFLRIIKPNSVFLSERSVKTGLLPLTCCLVESSNQVAGEISVIVVKQSPELRRQLD